jgi:two-component system chemotaxis sensor kinase CheA
VDDLTKEFIAESHEALERMELCLTELEKQPARHDLDAEIFRAVHTIKGATGFLGFIRLEKLAHAGESLLAAMRDAELPVTLEVVNGLLELLDGLRAILHLIETIGSEGIRAHDEDGPLIAMLTELRTGATTAPVGPPAHSTPNGPPSSTSSPITQPASAPPPSAPASSASEKSLRIDTEVLNRLMNLVGELVLTRNQILQSSPTAPNFPDLARRLDSVTADLRESVMDARMQPVGHLFSKFPRMVRDLSRTCGRMVRLEFEGQQTGLDKGLLEAIRDPLAHAVRNSIDHGIESPADRIRAGKPAEGVLRFRASHQNGSVVIEVADDGKGIATERVLAKAIERGLVTAERAASISEHEALQLIFVPGFSTATGVTSISGRGVGMDVVRANVEKVGGSIELESRLGLGTTLRLRVPLTLAIVPAFIVRGADASFALPQTALVELVYLPRGEAASAIEALGTAHYYRLRDRLLPLVWLDRLLHLNHTSAQETHGVYIVVVEAEGRRFGLVVDDLVSPTEIVVKPLSAALREIGIFSGATVLGTGALALILDIAAIGERAGIRPATEASRPADAATTPTAAEAARIPIEHSMVISELRPGERTAIPLSQVERIESLPLSAIEFAGGNPILQYRGQVLRLQDDGRILPSAPLDSNTQGSAPKVTILICLVPTPYGAKRMGIAVRRVLDIAPATLLPEDTAVFSGSLAKVNDRILPVYPDLVPSPNAHAAPLREVA